MFPGLVGKTKQSLESEGYSIYALKELLTITAESYKGAPTRAYLYHETPDAMYFPRNFFDFYRPESVQLNEPREYKSTGRIVLRDYQVQAIEAVKGATLAKGGAILIGGCGTGKTVMGCFLMQALRCRTLVLVHKEFLMQQFKQTLETAFDGVSVGIWQKDNTPLPEHDVVITMVQSLCAREYDASLYEGFDLVLTDEVHRFSAPLWSSVIERFGARYRVGLTATPERSDGMERVFFSHIGDVAYTVQGNLLQPTIYRVSLPTHYSSKMYTSYDGSISTALLLNLIADDDERTRVIAGYVYRAVTAGRCVLVLTDRRGHAEEFRQQLSLALPDKNIALYLGGIDESERVSAEQKADVLVGTYAMAQEGLDIPRLDTLVLASPKTNVTQAVGRILRPFANKQSPIVLDFVDDGIGILKGYARKRFRQYADNAYIVKTPKA